VRPQFSWLDGVPRKPPIDADLVALDRATFVGFSSDEAFAADAEGAARLAERLGDLNLGKSVLLVLPARLSPSAAGWLARVGLRSATSASKALRCTALRLAGYEIVKVVDESGHDAVIGQRV
jgi:hypothetical protein